MNDLWWYLVAAMFLFAVSMKDHSQKYICLVFASSVLIHDLVFGHFNSGIYYLSDAIFLLLVMVLLSGVQPMTRTNILLQRGCVAGMVFNLVGYGLWFHYYPPIMYDLLFVGLYTYIILTMAGGDNEIAGDNGFYGFNSCFRFSDYLWREHLHKIIGKA